MAVGTDDVRLDAPGSDPVVHRTLEVMDISHTFHTWEKGLGLPIVASMRRGIAGTAVAFALCATMRPRERYGLKKVAWLQATTQERARLMASRHRAVRLNTRASPSTRTGGIMSERSCLVWSVEAIMVDTRIRKALVRPLVTKQHRARMPDSLSGLSSLLARMTETGIADAIFCYRRHHTSYPFGTSVLPVSMTLLPGESCQAINRYGAGSRETRRDYKARKADLKEERKEPPEELAGVGWKSYPRPTPYRSQDLHCCLSPKPTPSCRRSSLSPCTSEQAGAKSGSCGISTIVQSCFMVVETPLRRQISK